MKQLLLLIIEILQPKMPKQSDNYLLAKTNLGEVKKGFHHLPAEGHTYGRLPPKDKEGAREVIGSWELSTKTEPKKGGKNYIAMNRQGAKNKCTDSKQISEFRKKNEIKVQIKEGKKVYEVKIPDEDFTYGVVNRPSTPIKNVICNGYAATHEEMQAEKNAVKKMLGSDQKKSAVVPISPPKAKQGSDRKKEIEANEFKLSKFKNVPSKIKPLIEQDRMNKNNAQPV